MMGNVLPCRLCGVVECNHRLAQRAKALDPSVGAAFTRDCDICGKPYPARTRAYLKGEQRTCSRGCAAKSISGTPILLICGYCGKEHSKLPGQLKHGRGQFCSKDCANAAKITAPEIRHASYVDRSSSDGDWPWAGHFAPNGYGLFSVHPGESVGAHRFALEQRLGRLLGPNMQALHTCDVKACCRNDGPEGTYEINGVVRIRYGHLWEGTHQDNMADRHAKGRDMRGERQHKSILMDDQIRDILARHSAGEPQADIARAYEVTRQCIYLIVHRKAWKHVE